MNRRDAVAIAIIVTVVTLLFSDVLFLGRAFYFRDVTRFYYPMKKVTRDIILSDRFPSWNPALSEGQPLAANPEFAVFYPPNWLLLLPDYEFAFRLHVLLHYYLAAIGVYLFLRSRTLRLESAMFGAFAYTFGGLLLSLSCLIPYLFCLAWLPWIAYFSRRNAAIASICLAMILLGGEPVTIAQCLLMLAIFVWRSMPKRAALIVAGALLIAIVQIVPAADHFRDSVRSRPFAFSLVSTWSTPPVKALELFIPEALGSPADHARFYWGTARYGWLDPFFLSIYPGLLTAALAIAALTLRRRGWMLVTAALLGGFLIAIGSHTPLLKLMYDLRLFSSFRYPEKFLILAIVPLTIFAAFAFDRIDEEVTRRAIVIASIAGLLCLGLIAFVTAESFIRFWSIEVHPLRNVMAGTAALTWWSGLARAVSVVALLLLRGRMSSESWSRLAVAMLVVDLAIERPRVAETIDHGFFAQRPAMVPHLPSGTRLFHQADWYGATPAARAYFDLPEMYWVIRNGAYPHTNATLGIESALNRDIDQTALLPTADLLSDMRQLRTRTPRWVEVMAAVSGAGYRALFAPMAQAGSGTAIAPIVFVPLPPAPRFYFADRAVAGDFVSAAADRSWTRRTAVVSQPAHTGAAEILTATQTSNSATLRVRASADALLVCSITRHKYWRASIDGRPATLIPANIAYQALAVPAGAHDIELRYDNPLFRWCGPVSLLALIAAAILAMIRHRDRAQL